MSDYSNAETVDQAQAPRAGATLPRRVGPYRLVRELGHGGMGTVFLAERDDEQFRKTVALKVVRTGNRSEHALRQFRRERQILAGLEHPSIARLLDGGTTEGGEPYLVMEHVEGEPVDRYCDGRRLGVAERLGVFLRVCDAVAYAHRSLVVHRDIKPANILVTADGMPKLLDFGIARLIRPDSSETGATATDLALTPWYASPEQVKNAPITTATDVYSLGVVLYELLTGRRPYRVPTESPIDVMNAVCEQEAAPPSTGGGGRALRGDLDAIVLKALRKEPDRRYPSVAALADDVRRHLDAQPVLARRGTFAYRSGRFLKRHWLPVAAAAVALGLVLAFAVAATLQARRADRERQRADTARRRAEKVSAFLVGLFEAANPEKGRAGERADTVTAREILDRGIDKTRRELAAEPEIRAALLAAQGQSYAGLGEYTAAEKLLREALALRQGGGDALETADGQAALARVLSDEGRYVEAEALDRQALATRRRLLGDRHLDVAAASSNVAVDLQYQGRLAEAEALHRGALALRRRLPGADDLDVATSLSNLAVALYDQGRFAEAEALHREALDTRRKRLGSGHLDVAASVNDLAVVLCAEGRYAEAAPLFAEAIAVKRTLLGPKHPEVAMSLANLANTYLLQGRFVEAEPFYRQALALQGEALGPGHPDVAAALGNLAEDLGGQGRFAEAEALYRRALSLQRAALGDEHPDVATTLANLGACLAERGRYAEAEALGRRALALRRKLLGPDHPDVAASLANVAAALADQGRDAAAEPLAAEAVALAARVLPGDDVLLAECRSVHVQVLAALRRYPEAEEVLRLAEPVVERAGAPALRRATWRRAARLYDGWNKPSLAEAYRARPAAAQGVPSPPPALTLACGRC